MKKTAILLAAIMVMSLSMTACNSNNDEGDYEEEPTISGEVVEDDSEETTANNGEVETSDLLDANNLYDNDNYSLTLPAGWVSVEGETSIYFGDTSDGGDNAVVAYAVLPQNIFDKTEEDFVSNVEASLGVPVTMNNFGMTTINSADVLQVEYSFEKDGVTLTQTYLYQQKEDKTLTFLFTNKGASRSPVCDAMYQTLTLK